MKKTTEKLLMQKIRNKWIMAPRRSIVFNDQLNQLEAVLKTLSRDEAFDLSEFTVKHFKMKNIKTVLPPATSQGTAAEILCDELKIYLDRQRSVTIFRKMVVFKNHYMSLIA